MGVSAKVFVTAKKSKANIVYKAVKEAIDKWQRILLREEFIKRGFDNLIQFLYNEEKKELANWSNGVASISTQDFGSFNITFRVKSEQRALFCTHVCSSDYSDTYKGDKIIFSLGCWGMSDEIMQVVATACKEFGEVYYDFNDCDKESFVKL